MADGFLNRWSQRKQDVRAGKPLAEPVIVPPPPEPVQINPNPVEKSADVAQAAAPELPTLADAQQLTPASDFKPFMVRGVAADVKNGRYMPTGTASDEMPGTSMPPSWEKGFGYRQQVGRRWANPRGVKNTTA